jgi:hypothetical protein
MSAMMTLREICKVSGASEAIMREAVQLGLVRPIWARRQHARQLLIDSETGGQWAETYAAALAARRPPPPPPAAAAVEPDPVNSDDDADDTAPKPQPKEPKPATPRLRQPQVRFEPILEPLEDGERAWTISELVILSGASRQTIMSGIHGASLAVVSTSPYLISSKSAEAYIAARERRLAEIRINKMRKRH